MKKETSCGCIIFNGEKVLLVYEKRRDFWDFPKGHMEPGETELETAHREVREEVGIEVEIDEKRRYTLSYNIRDEIDKTVVLYAARPMAEHLTLQESEIENAKWCDPDEAVTLLTFEAWKDVLRQALKDRQAPDGKTTKMTFRPAFRTDTGLILDFIRKLAEYENAANEVIATETQLNDWLFLKRVAEVVFVMDGEKEVGFALYFHNFSTWLGKAGIYLEDLFVLPEYRGKGYGKGLLRYLAQTAIERGCGRLEWACLDWNRPSIDFYLSLGAVRMDDWTTYRLAGETLRSLAENV